MLQFMNSNYEPKKYDDQQGNITHQKIITLLQFMISIQQHYLFVCVEVLWPS